uniref:Putative ABC transport system permease protein n=1 Tax=Candidatus Kentrum sp. SD TaxID=2126332 RepID=A0A450YPV9_9GAMM|nr:MAG: putative ABC transport system permease protein [Candidatus Kentron sp. SD]VFK43580.1 MAG: putative ABC transport system permease protein [Candidatus Kentron sp. SD]VFK78243.1 MAG: putative ABC transport system permease protein [Candidatus Kentron sp. SD]
MSAQRLPGKPSVGFIQISRLAFRDYAHEWVMSGCFVLALAAVLAPMMVLFGLKFGIVTSMLEQLVEEPRNREMRSVGSGRYDAAWFESMAKRPTVGFVIPRTRNIAATIQLKSNTSPRIVSTELIPTAVGEPLLEPGQPIPGTLAEIVLSDSAARKLTAKVGDVISGSLSRRFQGRRERVYIELSVIAIAQPSAFARAGGFVSIGLVTAIEDFRDGRAVQELGWRGDLPAVTRTFPGFRLFARTIDDVVALRDTLMNQGIEVRTRLVDIEMVQTMDRNFSAVFWIIAVIGFIGFSFSLGASLWANVERKRRDLSVLRLVGFHTGDIVWFPVLQAIFTALLGWMLATSIYIGVEQTINRMLTAQLQPGQVICELLWEHFLIAAGLTILAAVFAATLGGYRSARIEPSEGLRDT